mmetsp:Transcript_118621/g.382989  ORF Transcript_118621/g.382989 Transcript_118621/m.382989 type:complete len:623 (+) Transcript_118621:3-1871(+)
MMPLQQPASFTSPSTSSSCESEDRSGRYSQMVPHDESGVERMEGLRRDIAEGQNKVESQQEYVQVLRMRLEAAEADLEHTETQIETWQHALQDLQHPVEKGPPPPGPRSLLFVDGDGFTVFSLSVIVVNVIVMIIELSRPKYAKDFLLLDHAFLIFYIVELTLKGLLHQRGLLFGKASTVCWNWIDLVIVLTGVLDMWIMPLISMERQNDGPSFMYYLRILRLARLVRILKIVRVFVVSDLSWTEHSHVFQTFIMSVICFNAILIGLEADDPDFFLWFYLENILLVIFTFEILVRLRVHGLKFFCDAHDFLWNWLDFTIVAVGIIDQWMLPTVAFVFMMMGNEAVSPNGQLGQIMMIIRMARLLRILRLVRLIRGVPQLKTLVIGIAKSMYGMGWVLVLTVTVLYICALLGVKLVNHEMIRHYPEDARDIFSGVLEAMFNLFIVMNADLGPMQPLFEYDPWSKLVMFFFTVMSNWAIFSILTAVVSDHMATVSSETAEERQLLDAKRREQDSMLMLNKLFDSLDSNHDGTISHTDFNTLLDDKVRAEAFCEATNLARPDLLDLFRILSRQRPGDVEPLIYRKDFIEGLKKESSVVSMRSMMRLEKRMADLEAVVRKAVLGEK